MKLGSLVLSFLALTCAGWLESASLADSHGKFPGKGSVEAYNKSCEIGDQAKTLINKGDVIAAIKLDRQAIATYPLDAALHHNLACDLYKNKQFNEAIQSENIALELEPDYVGAWARQGLCFEKLGKYDEAEQCYRKANSLKSDAETCFYIGGILELKKQFVQAKSWYIKARTLATNQKQIAQIDGCLGKLQPSLEASH